MLIKEATKIDAQNLTDLTFRSKAHWGYSSEQLEIWRDDLTVTANYIVENEVYVLFVETKIIGYYSWSKQSDGSIELNNLFVDPPFIGQGFGKILMQDFLARIKERGINMIQLFSEPQAENFYSRFGFKTVGQHQSSIKDRFLPIMELKL